MPQYRSYCRNCPEYAHNYKWKCSYSCSRIGKKRIKIDWDKKKPEITIMDDKIMVKWSKPISMLKIKEALENNLGAFISIKDMSYFVEKINELIK